MLAGLIATAVYLPAVRNAFTNWDDTAYLHNNPHMVASDGLWRIWTSAESPQYYPLTFTSFWIEHKLWGFEPLGYHIVNIVLHGINATLVVAMLVALGMTGPSAFVVGLLFAVSPIQVMSVAWVAERKNVLSTVFGLLALIACWNWARDGRALAYGVALFAFVLALLAKTAWLVLPIIALAGWLIVFRMRSRRALIAVLPFVVVSVAAAIVTWQLERQFTPDTQLGVLERVRVATGALVAYVRHALFPIRLYPFYPKWDVTADRAAAWLPLVGIILVTVALGAVRRRLPKVAAWGLVTFVACLMPILGFVTFANMDLTWISDHFAYNAVIGLYAAIVATTAGALRRLAPARRISIGTALTFAAAAPCVFLTWRDIPVWKDAISMWTRAAEKNPHSTVPLAGLAAAYIDAENLEAAVTQFEALLERDPADAHARAQLGWALVQLGRLDRVDARLHLGAQAEARGDLAGAIAEYQRAHELDREDEFAAAALAGALLRINQLDAAERVVDSALARHPSAPSLLHRKGAILDARGRPQDAEATLRRALQHAPNEAEIHYALGVALSRQGRGDEAIESYERAVKLRPEVARYWNNLGSAMLEAQRPDPAIVRFRRALALDPQDAAAWNNLGAALAESRRYDDAIDALRKAIEIAPQYVNAHHRLGKTLADAGRYTESVRSLGKSVELLGEPMAVGMMNELARLLAACPEASVRDSARAIQLAERVNAYTSGGSWEALDTLAIAQAATGAFDRATATATRALELARSAGATSAVANIEKRRDGFARREPYVGR